MKLQEAIDIIYIQEDIKSFSKEKIKHIIDLLKDGSDKSLEAASKILPSRSISAIINYAESKLPNFKKYYNEEKSKGEVAAVTIASLEVLKEKTTDPKQSKVLTTLLEKARAFFSGLGSGLYSVAKIIMIIRFWLLILRNLGAIVGIRDLIQIAATAFLGSEILFYMAVIGIILMLIGYLLGLWVDARKEESKYKNQNKNPYEEDVK